MKHTPARALALLTALASCASAPSSPSPDASADASAPADVSAPADAPPLVERDAGDTASQVLTYRAGPWMMPAGSERSNDCESWTLHNEEPLYLNAVEMEATLGMHHSNWFFVPDTQYPGPDGTWACRSRNFEQGVASYLGGVFFAQSTQIQRETQQFPEGTVVVIPPHARVIGALHHAQRVAHGAGGRAHAHPHDPPLAGAHAALALLPGVLPAEHPPAQPLVSSRRVPARGARAHRSPASP
jgi:hypothetical protein